jgi:segregation and condensation protein A
MIEKPVPWWRKALNYALSGIRSGFGLFPKPARPASLEASPQYEERILNSSEPAPEPEPNLDVKPEADEPLEAKESLTDRHTNSEAVLSVAESETEPTPAAVAEVAAAPDAPPPDPESILDVAPVSRPAVLVASTPPAVTPFTDEPLAAPEPIAETAEPFAEEAIVEVQELVAEEVISAEPNPVTESIQIEEFSPAVDEDPDSPIQEVEPALVQPVPVEPDLELGAEPEPEVFAKETPAPDPPVALADQIEEPAEEPTEPSEPAVEPEAASAVEPVPEPEPVVESFAEPTATLETTPEQPAEPAPAAEPISSNPPNPEPAPNPAAVQAPAELPAQPAANPIADEKAAAKIAARQKKLDDAAELSPFSVIVGQVYTGPLDLLLDLIRQQDIDIYDIPIAKITAQFLAYVNQLKATDVDVAGEFIYTASLLIHIKSKMLLPRSPAGPDETAEDPRRELVERLLEHERFKNAAQMLQQKQMLEAATWTNPGFREFQDDDAAEPEIAADTVDLVRIFRDILERARNRPVIDVEQDSVTVGQMIQFLARRLTLEDKPIALRRLLSHTRSERALVAMFLALLELVRLQAVLLRQDRAFSDIFIKKHSGFDAVMNQGLTNALDDWR